MPSTVRIEGVGALAHGAARTFTFERGGHEHQAFLLRHGAGFVAYVNRCPHWGVDLDLGEGRFYAPRLDRIYCRNHGALFDVHHGTCVAGPCIGQALERLDLTLDGDAVVIEVTDLPELRGED
jgi:nitrite reductase/ring-hydroxylating ferredoxin subunit